MRDHALLALERARASGAPGSRCGSRSSSSRPSPQRIRAPDSRFGVVDAWLDSLDPDPLDDARRAGSPRRAAAGLHEPEAAALATATPDGRRRCAWCLSEAPTSATFASTRTTRAAKAAELAANPRAALVFYWGPPLRRQVRVEGARGGAHATRRRSRTSAHATRESRLGAWASPQSRPLADRDELDGGYADVERALRRRRATSRCRRSGAATASSRDAIELWQSRAEPAARPRALRARRRRLVAGQARALTAPRS